MKVPWFEHDAAKGEAQWNKIRDAADDLAPQSGVRALMGEEIGTAGEVTKLVLGRLPSWFPGLGDSCPTTESGHFGAYYVRDYVDASIFDCDETGYLEDLKDAEGFGAVNHPDNPDGGSRWYCWHTNRKRKSGPNCKFGVSERPDVVKAVEVVNDSNMPSKKTLSEVDGLLLQGRLLSLVGGSDSHTTRQKVELVSPITNKDCPRRRSVFGWCLNKDFKLPEQEAGNDGKIGLAGRTYAHTTGGVKPDATFNSTALRDPVRVAIEKGATVASTATLLAPEINGEGPGNIVDLEEPDAFTLNLAWRDAKVIKGSAVIAPNKAAPHKNDLWSAAASRGRDRLA